MSGDLVDAIEAAVNAELAAEREVRVNVLPRAEAFADPGTSSAPRSTSCPPASSRSGPSRSSVSTCRPTAGRTSRIRASRADPGDRLRVEGSHPQRIRIELVDPSLMLTGRSPIGSRSSPVPRRASGGRPPSGWRPMARSSAVSTGTAWCGGGRRGHRRDRRSCDSTRGRRHRRRRRHERDRRLRGRRRSDRDPRQQCRCAGQRTVQRDLIRDWRRVLDVHVDGASTSRRRSFRR